MKPSWVVLPLLTCVVSTASGQLHEAKRLNACQEVLLEVMGVPEHIPKDLLDKAACVAVIPSVKKAAFGFGGRYGKGAVVCRTEGGHGPWGPPLMISLGGGSFGLQIGGESADFVFLIMNPKGLNSLLKDRLALGVDASVAAGPKGRSAEAATDAQMRAEILTYSRSRGLFVGISLEGAVISQDKDANVALYGDAVDPRNLLLNSDQPIPRAAHGLIQALQRLSPGDRERTTDGRASPR